MPWQVAARLDARKGGGAGYVRIFKLPVLYYV